jgi:threonine 3-dehydrogenase
MRAIRKLSRERGLTLCEVPVPTPAAGEVLVRVEAASVCGTDLHIYRFDEWASRRIEPPLTLGHELCGTVVALGANVSHVQEGDYVSAESHVTCGACFHCRTGRAHMCERTRILGVDRDGGFADYVVIPESVIWQNDRAKLPPEVACLQEPFGNAVFATSQARGRTVSVLGVAIGLFTIAIAGPSAQGACRLHRAVPHRAGRAPRRLNRERRRVDDVPRGCGATREGSTSCSDVRRPRRRPRYFRACATAVVSLGILAREIDIAESLIFKNLTVTAVNGREIWETWYTTRWLLEHGVVDLRPLITAELPLERFEEGFALLETGEACKIVLRPNGAGG